MSAQHYIFGGNPCTILQSFVPLEAFVVSARQFVGTGVLKDMDDKGWVLMLSKVCNQQVHKVLAMVGDLFVAFVSAAALALVHVHWFM